MRRVIMPSVAYPTVPYFSTLSHKQHDFRWEKVIEYETLVSIFFILSSEIFFILRRLQQDIITNVRTSSRTVPIIVNVFSWKINFLERVLKNTCIIS
jgi:hypothetical protein